MKKRFRLSPRIYISTNRAGIGPVFDWQEWFGGFYWLKVELWLGILVLSLEITNRLPDEEFFN